MTTKNTQPQLHPNHNDKIAEYWREADPALNRSESDVAVNGLAQISEARKDPPVDPSEHLRA